MAAFPFWCADDVRNDKSEKNQSKIQQKAKNRDLYEMFFRNTVVCVPDAGKHQCRITYIYDKTREFLRCICRQNVLFCQQIARHDKNKNHEHLLHHHECTHFPSFTLSPFFTILSMIHESVKNEKRKNPQIH